MIDWCLKLKLDITRKKKTVGITNWNLNDLNTKDIQNNEIIKNDLDVLNYNWIQNI